MGWCSPGRVYGWHLTGVQEHRCSVREDIERRIAAARVDMMQVEHSLLPGGKWFARLLRHRVKETKDGRQEYKGGFHVDWLVVGLLGPGDF